MCNLENEFNYVNQKHKVAIATIAKPYWNPNILAKFIAGQLKNRVSFWNEMKKLLN